MTSFTVKPNGTIKVEPTNKVAGRIQYYFKGMLMAPENATIIEANETEIIAVRDKDQLIVPFVKKSGEWLLKGSDTQKNLLFGTRFIYND